MAYVVRRPNGRFEIRESVHTDAGPRARTLATFIELDDTALARAAAAASRPFAPEAVRASARRAGATIAPTSADEAACRLLLEMRAGRIPSAGLRRLLVDELRHHEGPTLDAGDSIGDWIGASAESRGKALRDLLDLTDRLPPQRRRARLRFPRLAPNS